MIGKTVTWTSQAGGHSKTKTGTVLAVVRVNSFGLGAELHYTLLQALRRKHVNTSQLSSNQIKFDGGHATKDRLIIEVPRKSGVCDYYAPLLSVILKQNPELGGDPHAAD